MLEIRVKLCPKVALLCLCRTVLFHQSSRVSPERERDRSLPVTRNARVVPERKPGCRDERQTLGMQCAVLLWYLHHGASVSSDYCVAFSFRPLPCSSSPSLSAFLSGLHFSSCLFVTAPPSVRWGLPPLLQRFLPALHGFTTQSRGEPSSLYTD